MTIAAIYARKSTEQNAVADEQKSVTRQIDHASAYARAKGWTVADAHVYVDDGISGAEFANRPGYMLLLNALKPRAPFDALIVSELSRLGREQLEVGYTVKLLAQAGVRIFSYLDDKEILLNSPTDKFFMSAVTFAAEVERERARQRVTDAMIRKARAGHCCGGLTFGYRNREVVGPDGRRSHVEREIDEAQAAVVRRIFVLCAEGNGQKAIAKLLNADGLPSPRPHRGRPRAWAPSSVRVVLHNVLYCGIHVWNKRKQSDAWGQRKCQLRPERDWIRTEVPHLRIVTDDEWTSAHIRLQSAAAVYVRDTNGQRWGRPPSGIASKYLLSGFMTCARCGQSMTVRSSSHGRQFYYVCASFDHRGSAVCANGLRLPMGRADEAILTKMRDYVLDPEIVEGAISDAVAELGPSSVAVDAKRQLLQTEIRNLEDEQGRYIGAIAVAGHVEALARALQENDRRRVRLRHDLATLDRLDHLTRFDATRIERDLRKRLTDWRELLTRHTPLSRQVLSTLLEGRIAWTPRKAEGVYDFAGRVKFDQLLNGIVSTQGMVPVRGFAKGWCVKFEGIAA